MPRSSAAATPRSTEGARRGGSDPRCLPELTFLEQAFEAEGDRKETGFAARRPYQLQTDRHADGVAAARQRHRREAKEARDAGIAERSHVGPRVDLVVCEI